MANQISTSSFSEVNVRGSSLIVQADGKILVSGSFNDDFALLRFNADGTLDSSFSGFGIVTTDFSTTNTGGTDGATSMTLQSDGKILVAGYSASLQMMYGRFMYEDFAVVRYNPDGTLDTSFDGDGKVTTNLDDHDVALGLTLQSDGKILVTGGCRHVHDFYFEENFDVALVRYHTDGTLDTSFSEDGLLATNVDALDVTSMDQGVSVTVLPTGKILVAAQSLDITDYALIGDFALLRYNTDGSLDTTFDGDGIVTTDFGDSDDLVYSMMVQGDGKILVAGSSDMDFALVRYNPDGTLDTSFSGDGKITTDISGSGSYDQARSVAVQADGKILLAGSYSLTDTNYYNALYHYAIVRYNSDGSLDTTFDGDGIVTTDLNGDGEAYHVVTQSDGKILIVGATDGNFAMVRYNIDGSLDASFGHGGYDQFTAPIAYSVNPEYGSTDVSSSCNIVVTFNEAIRTGVGTITIHTGSATGPMIESYDVATSTNLTISGGTLTINPTSELGYSTHCYVTLSEGSITDLSGNSFAGRSSWDFTTEIAPTADRPQWAPIVLNGVETYPDRYTGPAMAAGGERIHFEYLLPYTTDDVLVGTRFNDFFNMGYGDDTVDAKEGNDVIDGGTGSNFLTGGAGTDIFFSDGRGAGPAWGTTWSTITDWQAGEQLSVWGWTPGTSRIVAWVQAGAAGYEGITMHADLNGDGTIDTSVTFTGITSQSQLPTPQEFDGVLWFV